MLRIEQDFNQLRFATKTVASAAATESIVADDALSFSDSGVSSLNDVSSCSGNSTSAAVAADDADSRNIWSIGGDVFVGKQPAACASSSSGVASSRICDLNASGIGAELEETDMDSVD